MYRCGFLAVLKGWPGRPTYGQFMLHEWVVAGCADEGGRLGRLDCRSWFCVCRASQSGGFEVSSRM